MMTRTLIEDQCWGIDDEASIQHLGGGGGTQTERRQVTSA